MALARELGGEGILQESLVVQGYIQSLKALYELREIIQPIGKVPPNRREDAKRYFMMYADGLNQTAAALPRWEATVRNQGDARGLTGKSVEVVQEAVDQMARLQTELLKD
jgi:hypothetical protein